MFQDSLNTYLITKLNLNTQGITFKGDYMFALDNGKFVIETQTNFTIAESNYSPCQIQDWQNTSQPFNRIDLQDFVLPFSVAFRESELTKGLESLDEFRTLLNGNGDTIDGLNVGFRIGQPSPPTSPLKHAGEFWILVDIIVMLSAGKNLTYGNGISFKMAKTTETLVDLIYSKIDIATTLEGVVTTPTYVSTRINGKSVLIISIDVFFEDNVTMTATTLLDELWQVNSANQQYDISIGYATPRTATCVVTSIAQHIENGVPIGYNITLMKAS